jgi:hypothetical protein
MFAGSETVRLHRRKNLDLVAKKKWQPELLRLPGGAWGEFLPHAVRGGKSIS